MSIVNEQLLFATPGAPQYLAVMDVVPSGPAVLSGLLAVLPLEKVVYHGVILGTSGTCHTLSGQNGRRKRAHKQEQLTEVFTVNTGYLEVL